MASAREWQSLRAARAEIAADEKAEQDERERPVREATEENQRLQRQLNGVMQARLLTMRDVEYSDYDRSNVYVSPGLELENTFDFTESVDYTVSEYHQFLSEPDVYGWYYDSAANRSTLFEYLNRNSVRCADRAMIRSAATRLHSFNCFETQPDPVIIEPEDQYQSDDPSSPKYVNLGRNEPPAPAPVHEGWDLQTGERRSYSTWDVNHMSSDQYRRIFRLTKSSFELPNVGPSLVRDTR
jgi:hypothetical protein